jgi:hypothetical protein
MPFIEVGRIGDIEVAHEIFKVRARRSDDKMKMVAHQDEGEQTDLIDFRRTGKKFQKLVPVEIGQENLLSSVAPARNVLVGVFILDAQGASHRRMISGARVKVKNKDLTPLPRQRFVPDSVRKRI